MTHTRSSRPIRSDATSSTCIVPFATHVAQSPDGFGYVGVGIGPGRSEGVESMRERRWSSKHAPLGYQNILMDHYARSLSEAKVHTYIEHVDNMYKRQWVWVGVVGSYSGADLP
jgi:hypothetical protein